MNHGTHRIHGNLSGTRNYASVFSVYSVVLQLPHESTQKTDEYLFVCFVYFVVLQFCWICHGVSFTVATAQLYQESIEDDMQKTKKARAS